MTTSELHSTIYPHPDMYVRCPGTGENSYLLDFPAGPGCKNSGIVSVFVEQLNSSPGPGATSRDAPSFTSAHSFPLVNVLTPGPRVTPAQPRSSGRPTVRSASASLTHGAQMPKSHLSSSSLDLDRRGYNPRSDLTKLSKYHFGGSQPIDIGYRPEESHQC